MGIRMVVDNDTRGHAQDLRLRSVAKVVTSIDLSYDSRKQ